MNFYMEGESCRETAGDAVLDAEGKPEGCRKKKYPGIRGCENGVLNQFLRIQCLLHL